MYLADDDTKYFLKSFKNINSVSIKDDFDVYEIRLYFENSHDDIILYYENEDFANKTFNKIVQKLENEKIELGE